MTIQPSDAELAAAARRDPVAFDALYRRFVPAVYRYARIRVESDQAAEDVTSAVLLDALAGLSGYRERGSFAAWLLSQADLNGLE